MKFGTLTTAVLAAGLFATPALAHPKLVASSPAQNATVAKPGAIKLSFSETLMPKLSGATLVMTGMPGMKDHPPMPVRGVKAATGADGKSLVLTPSTPLAAGTYRVDWHVVSADTHRVAGAYSFTVR